jgi:L-seryl-tRNA(Ser) seleniumtransferase
MNNNKIHPPKMDKLLENPLSLAMIEIFGRTEVKKSLGESLENTKEKWTATGEIPSDEEIIIDAEHSLNSLIKPPLTRVVNGTGVVIHTNLGRAPLSKETFLKAAELLSCYVDIEWDRDSGERGFRDKKIEALFQRLLETEMEVVVVNNCAAALFLVLNTFAFGKEAIVSRGELVEIGGKFRIPEILSASGAVLREVGSTNRTSLTDYEENINAHTRLILKVHHSNFKIVGFTEEAALNELLMLGNEKRIPVVYDFGSGLILNELAFSDEPALENILKLGPDIVCFSGDKLMGGCQAGFIIAKREFSDVLRKAPLLRALRVDKTVYHILGEVLLNYLKKSHDKIPALKILGEKEETLKKRAQRLKKKIERSCPGRFTLKVVSSFGRVGGGSAPLFNLPSPSLKILPVNSTPEALEKHLRNGGEPPILSVIHDGEVLIHARTLFENDYDIIIKRLEIFPGEDK